MSDDDLKAMFEALRQESTTAHIETRRAFNETADRIGAENRHFFATGAEALRSEMQLLAEGLSDTRETLAREVADTRQEMRRGFAETQAMIKFFARGVGSAHRRTNTR